MKRVLLFTAAAVTAMLAAASPPVHAQSAARARPPAQSAVTPWIQLQLSAIASHSTNPPRASRGLAHVSAAMFAAALAGRPHQNDAVAGAASRVLLYLYPDEATRINTLADELADVHSRSFARGRLIARLVVARARSDGSDAVWTGSPPVGDAFWLPTPPGFVYPPLEPLGGTWRTWNLRNGSQFRPGAPPAYGSPEFLAELNEVYDVSRNLTDEERRIADFWADGAGTVTPPGHWNRIAINLLAPTRWSTLRASRLFAVMNTAQADAFIACWDAKYTYWSLRPVTAIRRLIQPNWLSYIVTPPFPSYVSGHSTTSGAAATVLAAFFPRRADQLHAMAEEAAVSRLYGGIHFRSDNEAGLALGRRVGTTALRSYGARH